MTGPSSWIGRLADPASACLDSDSDFVENTTYYDLFVDGTTLGIAKVAAAFMKMHGHVGVFIVESRERRGEQAVLALFTNNFDKINPNDFVVAVLTIEERRFHPDKVVPANVRVDTLHVKKLLHALDEIDVKLLLELGFGFGFNAVYKVTDVPWVVVEITQMFVNNQTALKSKAKDGEAVACGAARRCSGLEGRERRRVRCCLFAFAFSSRPRGRCERRIACLTLKTFSMYSPCLRNEGHEILGHVEVERRPGATSRPHCFGTCRPAANLQKLLCRAACRIPSRSPWHDGCDGLAAGGALLFQCPPWRSRIVLYLFVV